MMTIRYLLIALLLAASLPSFAETITIDNPDARVSFVGTWPTSSNTAGGGPYGTNYRHDNAAGKGTKQAICRPNLPHGGPWLVYEYHSTGTNRAKNVPIQVVDAEGTHALTLNQQVNGGAFKLLGRYNFAAGQGAVIYGTAGTTNYVLFDALQFVNDSTPTLACAPLQLAPVAEEGQDAPPQTLSVSNSGGGSFAYALSADVPWISLTQTTGTVAGETDAVEVHYLTAGMAQGTYDGTITVTATGALNAPLTIPVQLRVATGPALDVTPTAGAPMSGLEGGPFVPMAVQFGVENLGGGNLNWTATAEQNWLTVSPASGTGNTTVTVALTANANALAGSTNGVEYIGVIHFASNGGEVTRTVMLNVLQGVQTITIDNTDARASYVGSWPVSSNTSGGGPYGANYRHDNGTGKGTKQAICAPNLPEAGYWWVYEYHSASTNRAKNVPVTVRAADGDHVHSVNQQVNGGTFNVLGRYYFAAGAGTVDYVTTGTTGIVVYDALRFVLEPSTLLACNTTQVQAQAVPGYNAASQTIGIRNSGSGVLNYQVTADAPWIVIAGGEGSSTGEEDAVELNFAAAGLAAGTYTATITIAAPGAANAPLQIPVTLLVAPPPTLSATPAGTFKAAGLEGGPFVFAGAGELQIANTGGGLLQWTATSDQDWLTIAPTSGSTAENTTTTVALVINANANSLAGSVEGITYTAHVTLDGNGGTLVRTVRLRVLHGAQTITIDNKDARVSYTGTWGASTNTGGGGPYLNDYRYDNNSGKGTKKAVCAPNLPTTGIWWVYEYHSTSTNRASNVPIEIDAADGTHSLTLNQKVNGGAFKLLGRYAFNAGAGTVTYHNAGTTGYVVFDALQFVLEPEAASAPSLELVAGNPTSNAGVAGRPGPKQIFGLRNAGAGPLNYTLASSATWLMPEPASGTLAAGATAEIVLHYDTAGLAPGVYSARLTIAAPDADNAPQVHDITLAQYEADNAIIIDNEDAGFVTTEGAWVFSRETSGGQPYNGSMMTNTVETTEARRAEFHATLDATALYDMYEWHTAAPEHDPWVIYQLHTTTGTQGVRVNQQTHGGQFNYLGRFMLPAGEATRVELLARSNATVVADAIMLRPVPESPLKVAPLTIERTYYTNSGGQQLLGAALHVANSGNGPLHYIACSTQPWLSFDCVTETSYDPNSVVWQTPEVETGYNPNDERVTCRGWAPCNPPPTETCHCPGNETCYNPGNETCYCPGEETHYCPGNETCYCPPETNYNPPPETCYQTRYVLPPQKEHVIRARCNPAGLPDGDYQAPLPVMACGSDGALQAETAYYNLHVRTLPEGFFTTTTQINLSYPQDAGEQTFEFEVQHRPNPGAGAENLYVHSDVSGTGTEYEATPAVGDKTITVRLRIFPDSVPQGTYSGHVILRGNMIGQLLIPVTLTITEAVHKPDFAITGLHQSQKLNDRNSATLRWAVSVRNDGRFYVGDPVQVGLYRETPNGLELLLEQSGYWFPPGQAQGFVFTSTVPNPTSMTLRAVVNLSHAVHENNYDNNISEALQVNSDWPSAPDEIIDNSDPKVYISGDWTLTSDSLNLYGPDCLVDAIPDDGQNLLTIYPRLPRAGKYWVEGAWPSGPERNTQIWFGNQLLWTSNFGTLLDQTLLGNVIAGAGEWHPIGEMFMTPEQCMAVLSNNSGVPGSIAFDALSYWYLGPDDPYEENNTRETAFDMTAWPYADLFNLLDTPVQGDTDWYRFDSANQGGYISLQALAYDDLGATLYDGNGQRLASNTPGAYLLDEQAGTWHDLGAALDVQRGCRPAVVGNSIYLFGTNYHGYVQQLDLGTSSSVEPQWHIRPSNLSFFEPQGSDLFVAGVDQQVVTIYPGSVALQKWDAPNFMLSNVTHWPGGGDDQVTGLNSNAVLDGQCYLIGGTKGDGQKSSAIHCYSLTSDTWLLNVAHYPLEVSGLCTVVSQGKIFGLGGQTADGQVTNAVYAYDPSTTSITPLAPLPTARCKAAAFVKDGKIWVCGGEDATGQPVNNIECYDPATDSWQPGPALPAGLEGSVTGAALADGRVVLFSQPVPAAYSGRTIPSNDAVYYLRFTGLDDGRQYYFTWM